MSSEKLFNSSSTATAAGTSTTKQDRRRSERRGCSLCAHIRAATSNFEITAQVIDISETGCYAPSTTPFAKGTTLMMTFSLEGKHLHCMGITKTIDPALGNGIEFVKLTDEDRATLRGFLESLASSDDQLSGLIR